MRSTLLASLVLVALVSFFSPSLISQDHSLQIGSSTLTTAQPVELGLRSGKYKDTVNRSARSFSFAVT